MIDLHCHYLPGVDDGASSLRDGLALARAAAANGIRIAVLTPHIHPGRYDNTLSSLRPTFEAFRQQLDHEQVPLHVRLGGEVRLAPESLELIDKNELPTMGFWQGKRVVLIEFPPGQIPVGSINVVQYLLERNWLPMLAHPERNRDIMQDWRRIVPFAQAGCLLQITAASVLGLFGAPARSAADRMLAAGIVTAMATDAHNLVHRPPLLAEARAAVAQGYGEQLAALLTQDNPQQILGVRAAQPEHYGYAFQSVRVLARHAGARLHRP